jgi:6,7-dimethyl-8-ribityllumazine synthase
VTSRFNETVTDRLLTGARDVLGERGVSPESITEVHVSGAFELPLACRWLAESGLHDGIVALGCVIRGGTDHYEHVCTQASRGIMDTMLATGVPIGFGVLTCDTLEQALDRAGGKVRNKGADAAAAVVEMIDLRDVLRP